MDYFINVMKDFAKDVAAGDAQKFHDYPLSTPRRRLDEVKAAREPKLRWKA
jgi:glycine dehydrogenase subunit 2